jgi:hypothetical protein
MIDIRITADTPAELHSTMLALLAGTASVAAAPATRGRGKKGEDKPEPPTAEQNVGEGNAAGEQGVDAGGSAGASSAAGEAPTKESLSPKVMQYGSKAGPQAVVELFAEFGAKKFSEVPVEKYGAFSTRLDELLAA